MREKLIFDDPYLYKDNDFSYSKIDKFSEIIDNPIKFADLKTINGTEIIQIKLVIAVNEIDNATSPFANFVKTFDVTPPGAEAIIIKPKAISIGNFKIKTII